jgi:molybdenum ABC transporter molybdate-binding protein
MRTGVIALAILAMTGPAMPETVQLYAAGSLRAALTDVAKAYEPASGHKVATKFGASGLLKDEIVAGAKTDVFASANMEHPQALHDRGISGAVILFTRNRLCALLRPNLAAETDTLLARMLEPSTRLATSTPKADPSGDYAFEVFDKAEALKAGARGELERKALQLTGSSNSAQPPAGRSVYGWHVAEGRADIFLTYCTNAQAAQKENPGQRIVMLPEKLAVGADYGLTVIKGASPAAQSLADFIMSPQGQSLLAGRGFASK